MVAPPIVVICGRPHHKSRIGSLRRRRGHWGNWDFALCSSCRKIEMFASSGLQVPVFGLEQRPAYLQVVNPRQILQLDELLHLLVCEIPLRARLFRRQRRRIIIGRKGFLVLGGSKLAISSAARHFTSTSETILHDEILLFTR